VTIFNKPADKIDRFINGATDGKRANRYKRGNKAQITLTIDEDLLDKVDDMAEEIGVSRAALISMGMRRVLAAGLTIGEPEAIRRPSRPRARPKD
jgi:hypothetical protein